MSQGAVEKQVAIKGFTNVMEGARLRELKDVPIHAAANLFPMMADEEYERLKADIKANGLHWKIVFYRGQLIDGRNRLRACRELKIDIEDPDNLPDSIDPVGFVLSSNLHRAISRKASVRQSQLKPRSYSRPMRRNARSNQAAIRNPRRPKKNRLWQNCHHRFLRLAIFKSPISPQKRSSDPWKPSPRGLQVHLVEARTTERFRKKFRKLTARPATRPPKR